MQPDEFQRQFGVSRETMARFYTYESILKKWQKAINLVSEKTLEELWSRHFADSAQLSEYIPQRARVADLGSGGGFPALVLAFLRLDLGIHLIESDERKFEFLRHVAREISIDVNIHNRRVEDILNGIKPDIITARAFSSLSNILDMAAGQIKQNENLKLVLLKGKNADAEIEEAGHSYDFDLQRHASVTDPEASILILSKISVR